MRQKAGRPFADAKRKRTGPSANPHFNPLQPRGGNGRWIPTGQRIEETARNAGLNLVQHTEFGKVRSPAALSKVLGHDVRDFRHSVSNQAIQHMRKRHPELTPQDWGRLPAIVWTGSVRLSEVTGVNGAPRLVYRATVEGRRYEYVAEYRRRARRLDAITLYRL